MSITEYTQPTSYLSPVRETISTKNRPVSHYTELLKRVKDAGLLRKKTSFYMVRLAIISTVALAAWVSLFFIAQSTNFWVLATAVPVMIVLGLLAAQYGFIAHETAHRQVFESNKVNDNFGRVLTNGLAGFSYGFWLKKHSKHHNKPNQINYDPDIQIGVISFTTESLEKKKGLEKALSKKQGWLFPFMLFFTGFQLLWDSFAALGKKQQDDRLNHKSFEFILMLIRQLTPIVFLFILFPPVYAGILWLVMFMTAGFNLGASFSPNHKGRPLVPEGSRVDFFSRQVLTSRNVTGSWLKDNLMGGLNYQVEHHLFPSMARPYLKQANTIVKAYCKEMNVPYVEMGLFSAYKEIIVYLNRVGLSSNADPFECPVILAYRP